MYPKGAPRQSVFAGAGELYQGDNAAVCSPYLRECVAAMEDCSEEVSVKPVNIVDSDPLY